MVDPDLINLLEKNLEVSKENNALLKKIWGSIKINRFFTLLHWILIIGITLGAYYYVQPYIENFLSLYKSVNEATSVINGLPSVPDVNLLNKILGL